MTQFYPKNLFNILLPLVIVSAPFTVASQQKLPGQSIHLIGGYSRHGSGDYNGIVFGAEYERYVNKRLSLIYSLRGTINDGKTPIYVTNTITGQITDASIRFTTAGVQLGVSGGYSIFRNKTHGLSIALGAFARYQSASMAMMATHFITLQPPGNLRYL